MIRMLNSRAEQPSIEDDPDMDPFELGDAWLRLRMWQADDVEAAYRACQDAQIQRWTTVPLPYTRHSATDWIERIIPLGWDNGTELTWAVVEHGETPAAAIAVSSRPDQAWVVAQIGFWTAPQARGRGIMTGAVRITARHAFAVLGVQRLEWYANVGNLASRRVAEKVGFTIEGTLRKGLDHRGTRVDAWIGSLLPGELLPGERP
jgi:RimJ/RimL family protein N-acetyltransferase